MFSTTKPKPKVPELTFVEKVQRTHDSEETQNIANYFINENEVSITDPLVSLGEHFEDFIQMFTKTDIITSCRLLEESNGNGHQYDVEFVRMSVEEENNINGLLYQYAYAMFQVRSSDKSNCVRILTNKKNHRTQLVLFLRNCVWSKHKPHVLIDAEVVHSIPFVLNLLGTPSCGFMVQRFLALGDSNVVKQANVSILNKLH